jgi:hypothetical protein
MSTPGSKSELEGKGMGILSIEMAVRAEAIGIGWSGMSLELSGEMLILMLEWEVGLETGPVSVPGSKVILILERESEGVGEGLRSVVAIDLRVWDEEDEEMGMRGLGALRRVGVGTDVSVVG